MFDYQMVWLMNAYDMVFFAAESLLKDPSSLGNSGHLGTGHGLESGHLSESNGDSDTFQTQMLHVWNIYLHLVDFWGKCR